MSHIAMFSIGAHGHVNPSLPVIAELAARGHRVSSGIPESFAAIVASSGAIPKLYESTLPDEFKGEQWPSEIVEAVDQQPGHGQCPAAIDCAEVLSGSADRGQP